MSLDQMMPKSTPYVLVIEDSDEDFDTLQRILSKHCMVDIALKRCTDGDEALDFIAIREEHTEQQQQVLPNLILLDLNLPGTDGRDVLQKLKADTQFHKVPVVIFTTSSNPKDIETCYQYGANSYVIKSMNIDHLKHSICTLMQYWFDVVCLPERWLC